METQSWQETDSKLREFFVDQLKDLYWAEKKLVKTLPKLQKAATTPELQEAFGNHLQQTEEHVIRLEQVFEMIDEEASAKKCPAMAGITDEGADIIDDTEEGSVEREIGLIFAGQKAEHYEIASYGGLISLAKSIGLNEAAEVLAQTLAEEKEADQLLTKIAESNINYQLNQE